MGSPPLARGILNQKHMCSDFSGITPARAGNTFTTEERQSDGRDHPRSRGEYTTSEKHSISALGSPPLARGIPETPAPEPETGRITPARAGNTRAGLASSAAVRDHPRSRGEYAIVSGWKSFYPGSPPLARGILILIHFRTKRKGITPARAGNTHFFIQIKC